MPVDTPIGALTARVYTVPTDAPEADGTFAWQETTLIVVTAAAGGLRVSATPTAPVRSPRS